MSNEKTQYDESLRAAFLAGFMSSREGWNGEYPFDCNKASAWENGVDDQFTRWCETGETTPKSMVRLLSAVREAPRSLSEEIRHTSVALEEIGCTDAEIRLACLVLCGVSAAPLKITAVGITS